MTPETFKDIIDQELSHNPDFYKERIVMHGYGESLINPYFFENLDYLQAKGFNKVDFSDNCMLMTEEIVKKLCTYTIFNYIKLSLNSSRKELMEYINTGTDFDKVVKNIQMICDIVKEYGQPFQIQVQLMHTNLNMDEKPQEVIDLIGRDNFVVLECKIEGMLSMDNKNDLLIPDYRYCDGNCVFSEVSRMYHWDGDYVGCCVDNTKTQVIGNIKDGIYSEKVENRRKQLNQELKENNFTNLPACEICEAKKR
jgi:MoaA/NifB/PqqE/SkfB family radical SAM enzyme